MTTMYFDHIYLLPLPLYNSLNLPNTFSSHHTIFFGFLITRCVPLVYPLCIWLCDHPLEQKQPTSGHKPKEY